MPVKRKISDSQKQSIASHRTSKRPKQIAKALKASAGRGVLRRVVERVVDPETRKQHCVLDCKHEVIRSAGQYSDRCYCIQCEPVMASAPKKSLTKEERKKLHGTPIVGSKIMSTR